MKKTLVLGAGGFIGGHLVNRLKNENYWVNMAETLGVYKESLEKSGQPVYDRIQDLLNLSVQQAHLYNALIADLTIIKHGRG